jgi:hypothetical protein
VAEVSASACPSWCTRKHDTPGLPASSHSTVREMADGDTWVALNQATDGKLRILVSNHQISKGSESLIFDLTEAPHAAGLLGRLGHEDIAAAITELAALVIEAPRGAR